MNKLLHEMIFSSGEELNDAISAWLQTQETDFFSKYIKLLTDVFHWKVNVLTRISGKN
jgi:hypothetical protein